MDSSSTADASPAAPAASETTITVLLFAEGEDDPAIDPYADSGGAWCASPARRAVATLILAIATLSACTVAGGDPTATVGHRDDDSAGTIGDAQYRACDDHGRAPDAGRR